MIQRMTRLALVLAAVILGAPTVAAAQMADCAELRRQQMELISRESAYRIAETTILDMVSNAQSIAPNVQTATEADLNTLLSGVRRQILDARQAQTTATDPAAVALYVYMIRTLEAVESYVADTLVRRAVGDDTSSLRVEYEQRLSAVSGPVSRFDAKADQTRREREPIDAQITAARCPELMLPAAPPTQPPPVLPPTAPPPRLSGTWNTTLGPMTIITERTAFNAVTLDGYLSITGTISDREIRGTYVVTASGLAPGAPYSEMNRCPTVSRGSIVWGVVSAGIVRDDAGNVTAFEGVYDYCGNREAGVTLQRMHGERQAR